MDGIFHSASATGFSYALAGCLNDLLSGNGQEKAAVVPPGGAAPGGGAPPADLAAGGGAPPMMGAGGGVDPSMAAAGGPPSGPLPPEAIQQLVQGLAPHLGGGAGKGKKAETQILDAKLNFILRLNIAMCKAMNVPIDADILMPAPGDPSAEAQAQQELQGSPGVPSLGGDGGAGAAAGGMAGAGAPPMAQPKAAGELPPQVDTSIGQAYAPLTPQETQATISNAAAWAARSRQYGERLGQLN